MGSWAFISPVLGLLPRGGPYRLSLWKMNKISNMIIFIAYRFGDKDTKIHIVLYRFASVS